MPVKLNCQCGKEFTRSPSKSKGNRFCSGICQRKYRDFRKEKHPKWKGDDVSYSGLHKWVSDVMGTPDTCEHCKKSGLTGRFINWANKSGKYLRKKTDWLRLCKKCHCKYDNESNQRNSKRKTTRRIRGKTDS